MQDSDVGIFRFQMLEHLDFDLVAPLEVDRLELVERCGLGGLDDFFERLLTNFSTWTDVKFLKI